MPWSMHGHMPWSMYGYIPWSMHGHAKPTPPAPGHVADHWFQGHASGPTTLLFYKEGLPTYLRQVYRWIHARRWVRGCDRERQYNGEIVQSYPYIRIPIVPLLVPFVGVPLSWFHHNRDIV